MWKKIGILVVILCAAVVAVSIGCSGDDDDDDNDTGDDDSAGGDGVCFWYCEWFDQVAMEGPTCLSVPESQTECEETAEASCVTNLGGTLVDVEYDDACDSCDDESCWPDWADFD